MSIFADEVENTIFWMEKFLKFRYSNSLGVLQETSNNVSNKKKGRGVFWLLSIAAFNDAI